MAVSIETKTVKLSDIKLNPDNPRRISDKQMERLVKSLQDFPDMLQLREIVVDEDMMILGGNMRYLALKKIDEKECMAKIVEGLTPEQKREFIIKDNGVWGEWDMDLLANSWDDLPLADWGLPDEFHCLDGSDEEKLVQEEREIQPYKKVHILISIDIDKANEAIDVLDKLRKLRGVEIEQSAN